MAVIRVTSPRADGGFPEGLTLGEAISLVNQGKNTAIEPAKKKWVTGDVEMDGEIEIRLELDGEKQIVYGKTGKLESPLPAIQTGKKLIIQGGNAVICGANTGIGLILSSSDITVKSLSFSGFYIGIFITQEHRSLRGVSVSGCKFTEISQACILAGLTAGNLEMTGIEISGCEMTAPSREHRMGSCTAALVTAALDRDGSRPIHNVSLKGLLLARNKVRPNPDGTTFAEGFTIYASCDFSYGLGAGYAKGAFTDIDNCVTEDVCIEENEVDGVDDTCIGFLGALPARSRCAARNFRISGNRVFYTLTGICASSCNQYAGGESYHCTASGIVIEGNYVAPSARIPHEPSMGIGLLNVRAESRHIMCADCVLEHAAIRDNEIIGRDWGIVLEAMHVTQDLPAPSKLSRCEICDVEIENNRITNARQPIRIFGVRMEGRTDAFWGRSLEEANPEYPYSAYAEENSVDRILIRGNTASGFECFLVAAGAWAAGRGFARDNRVGPHIVLEGNLLQKGEKVFTYRKYVSDQILLEEACGMGNRALGEFHVPSTHDEEKGDLK